jgi:hypothetical protein
MGIQKEIIETELRTTTSQSQAELAKLEGSTGSLIDKNKELRLAMSKLEADGKKNGDQWKNLSALYKENGNAITQNKGKMELLRKEIGITGLSATQLSKRANELKRELNGMTKSADPARWNKLNNELKQLQTQQIKVRAGSDHLKGSFAELGNLLPGIGSGITNIITKLAALGPIGGIIAGVVGALSLPFIAFFKKTADGSELLERKMAGLKETVNVIAGKFAKLGRKIITDLEEPASKASSMFSSFGTVLTNMPIAGHIIKVGAASIGYSGLKKEIKEARVEIETITGIMQELDDEERKYLVTRSLTNRAISDAKLNSEDETKSIEARVAAYKDTLNLEKQTVDEEIKFAERRVNALGRQRDQEVKDFGIASDEILDQIAEAEAHKNDLQTESNVKQRKMMSSLNAFRESIDKKEDKSIDDKAKKLQEATKLIQNLIDEQYRAGATASEKEIEDIQRKHEAIIEAAMTAGKDKEEIDKLELAMDKEVNDKIIEQNKEKNQKILDLAFELQEKKFQILKEYEQFTSEELEQMELDRLAELYTEEEQQFKEYQDLKAAIEKKYDDQRSEKDDKNRKKKLDNIMEELAAIEAITQVSLNAINTLRNTDLDELEAQKQKELDLAGDNADEKERIEKEYGEKAKAIKKKYADIEFILTVANITATTAQAAINAYQSMAKIPYVGPILGGIAAAATVAYGAIQISNANKQRNIVKQLAQGRYNVTGNDDNRNYSAPWGGNMHTGIYSEPTLVADHGREMVIDYPTLRNIETNDPYLLNRIYSQRVPQHAEGKYPDATAGASAQAGQQTIVLAPGLVNVLTSLNNAISKGITAHIVYSEITNAEATMNSIEGYASGNDQPVGYVFGPTVAGINWNTPVYKNKRR